MTGTVSDDEFYGGNGKDILDGGKVLYVMTDALTNAVRHRINLLAAAAHLPTIYPAREYVEVGCLLSYGPSYPDMFRRAAEYSTKFCAERSPGRSSWMIALRMRR